MLKNYINYLELENDPTDDLKVKVFTVYRVFPNRKESVLSLYDKQKAEEVANFLKTLVPLSLQLGFYDYDIKTTYTVAEDDFLMDPAQIQKYIDAGIQIQKSVSKPKTQEKMPFRG